MGPGTQARSWVLIAPRRLFVTTVTAALITGLGGCKSVDVGPYYDAAVAKYEAAQVLEQQTVGVRSRARAAEFAALFDQMEQMTKAQLKQMIVLQWDTTANDFKPGIRDEAWRAFAGVSSDAALPANFETTRQPVLVKHLSTVMWKTTGTPPVEITGADVIKKSGGIASYTGSMAPGNPIAEQAKYDAWREELVTTVFDAMPAVEKIAAGRAAALRSIRLDGERGAIRVDATYDALIGMTLTTKQYAETLTRNAKFISLANKILESANSTLGKLQAADVGTGSSTDAGGSSNAQ